jgi:DNA-binding response OmpR family regulator
MPSKILVVDDDPDIREVLTMILEARDYEVITAQDGIECLALLRADNPDLMIVDLLMPKMDGFALLRELEEERWSAYKKTPILILSSVREEASRRRYELETALEFNVDDYIEKPIDPDVLLERVGNLLHKKK